VTAVYALPDQQRSPALLVCCSDGTLPPDLCDDAFAVCVLQTPAGWVPGPSFDEGSAATIHYAIEHLRVERIVVAGHSRCRCDGWRSSDRPSSITHVLRQVSELKLYVQRHCAGRARPDIPALWLDEDAGVVCEINTAAGLDRAWS
jgi:carbonic anhydrase